MRASHIVLILLGFLTFVSCEENTENPFDNPDLDPPIDEFVPENIPLDNFAGLYNHIFKPTCSNSGCHDGTFEPDFRNMESSYNTLVYHNIIKNDTIRNYPYRVAPGDADNSILMVRLLRDIDGLSGIMPLVVDPDSDWEDNKVKYLSAVRDWIQSGAKDVFGNSPVLGNPLPQMLGAQAFIGGNKVARNAAGTMLVPSGTQFLDLYLSFSDDETATNQLTLNEIKFSIDPEKYDSVSVQNMQIVPPITEKGFSGDQVEYYHKITITPTNHGNFGETVYFQVYVQDSSADTATIPGVGASKYILRYMAFELI
jgi:hypothetical protein